MWNITNPCLNTTICVKTITNIDSLFNITITIKSLKDSWLHSLFITAKLIYLTFLRFLCNCLCSQMDSK